MTKCMEVFLRLKDLHAYGKICESVHKTASANKICIRHVTVSFFTHTDWFYAVNPFCSSLNCCFRLQITVHRLAVLLTVFWRKKRAKTVSAEKWKSYECRSYLFSVSMKLHFHNTWITLTSNRKMRANLFFLRLKRDLHFHKSYHTHANLYDVKLPSYKCFQFQTSSLYCHFALWP